MAVEEYDRALLLVERESEAFARDLEGIEAADWERPTNCPPWTVRLLAAHLTRGAESYLASIESGLRGELAAFGTREERERRMRAIAALPPDGIIQLFRANARRFAEVYGSLRPDGVETMGVHSYGPRTARWFVEQRLAEAAFHRWDLEYSLGRSPDLAAESADVLLPFLYEQNLAPTFQRNAPSGQGRFKVRERGGSRAWTLIATNGFLGASSRSAAPVDATLEGDTAALCLLVYGRQSVVDLEQAGRLQISGDRAVALRFSEIFRGP